MTNVILNAALYGSLGNLLSLAIEFKKARDAGKSTRQAIEGWDAYRFAVTMLIGGVAGAWASGISQDPLAWFSFGYMGASAIDTLATKKLP